MVLKKELLSSFVIFFLNLVITTSIDLELIVTPNLFARKSLYNTTFKFEQKRPIISFSIEVSFINSLFLRSSWKFKLYS